MKNIILILAILTTLTSCQNHGNKLNFNGTEVYYKGGVTKEQAEKLGSYLISEEFVDGEEKSVQLVVNKKTKNLTFRIVVDKALANSSANDYIFTSFSRELTKIFDTEVDFEICDNSFKTLKVFLYKDVPKLLDVNKTQLLYTKNVTKKEAENLASYLVASEFADGNLKTVELDRKLNTYLFRMVVYKGAEKNEANVKLLGLFAKDISINVFDNKTVELHMCDDMLKTVKIAPY